MSKVCRSAITEIQKVLLLYCIMVPFFYLPYTDIHCSIYYPSYIFARMVPVMKKLPVSCNKDCGGGCPLIAHIEDGRLQRITNNPLKNPYMTGCVRGYQMPKVVYAHDRLTSPLVRTGKRGSGKFSEISWEEGLDLVAQRLQETGEKYGQSAILSIGGSGSCVGAVHNTAFLKERFFRLLGNCTEPDGNYSEQAIEFTGAYLFGGSRTGLDPATLQHSNLIILWGANIVDNRFGCEMESRIREARPTAFPVISNSFIPWDATSCPREATCTRTSGPFRKPNSPYATTTS